MAQIVAAELPDGVYELDPLTAVSGSIVNITDQYVADAIGTRHDVIPYSQAVAVGEAVALSQCVDAYESRFISACRINNRFQPFSRLFSQTFPDPHQTKRQCVVSFDGQSIRMQFTDNGAVNEGGWSGTSEQDYLEELNVAAHTFKRSMTTQTISKATGYYANINFAQTDTYKISGGLTWVGPLGSDTCPGDPKEPRLLNPFALYPNGKDAIDLQAVAQLAANLSGASATASGSSIVLGMATDGVTRGIIAMPTKNLVKPVTFTLQDSTVGKLIPLSPGFFEPAVGGSSQLTVQPVDFIDVPGKPDLRVAAVTWVAPETPADFKNPKSVRAKVVQGTKTQYLQVSLYAPPVLFVHGLWANASAWNRFIQTFPTQPFAAWHRAQYPNSLAFDSSTVQQSLQADILTTLDRTRRKGILATQVNVVAHSMGGLATRAHSKGDYLLKLRDFGEGDVNQLITIDTPHLGSPFASFLNSHRQARFPCENFVSAYNILALDGVKILFPHFKLPLPITV